MGGVWGDVPLTCEALNPKYTWSLGWELIAGTKACSRTLALQASHGNANLPQQSMGIWYHGCMMYWDIQALYWKRTKGQTQFPLFSKAARHTCRVLMGRSAHLDWSYWNDNNLQPTCTCLSIYSVHILCSGKLWWALKFGKSTPEAIGKFYKFGNLLICIHTHITWLKSNIRIGKIPNRNDQTCICTCR